MSRPVADIIIVIKAPDAVPMGGSRPFVAFIRQMASEHGIRLQVEDFEGGLLLFLQDQGDFERIAREMGDARAGVSDAEWGKGEQILQLSLLKPAGRAERVHLLETCQHLLALQLGPRGAAEVTGEFLTFRAPIGENLLMAFWRPHQDLLTIS